MPRKNHIIGIYQIQSILKPDRIYIGSSHCIEDRKAIHLCRLRLNKHHSIRLQAHYNKYGESDLVFSIVEVCNKNFILKREQSYIDKLRPWFNICLIAGNTIGRKASEETKRKMSEAMMGKKMSPEAILKSALARTGIKFSKEACANISRAHKGIKLSNETRLRMSEAHKGIVFTDEHKANISKAKKEAMSTETREKIGVSHRRENLSIETLEKMSISQINRFKKENFSLSLIND